jgi:hypothetical protein
MENHGALPNTPAYDLHRILCTSISIFDSAIRLLGEPPDEGVQLPDDAHADCIISILTNLGIGGEEECEDAAW